MTKQIIISYRRDDSPDVTGRIYDQLVANFGELTVFKDVDDIPLGVNFKEHLNNVISQCSAMLVIIGPKWLNVVDDGGNRRLDNPNDFVRIEVQAALSRDIPVIPLLVSGASMPSEVDLPKDISALALRNGIPIRADPDFHHDMRRLMRGLDSYIKPHMVKARGETRPPFDLGSRTLDTTGDDHRDGQEFSFVQRWWKVGVQLLSPIIMVLTLMEPPINLYIFGLFSIAIIYALISFEHFTKKRNKRGALFATASIFSVLSGMIILIEISSGPIFANQDFYELLFIPMMILFIPAFIWSSIDAVRKTSI